MRRGLLLAVALWAAGCDSGPRPGGVYVLTNPEHLYEDGVREGDDTFLRPGAIVRVIGEGGGGLHVQVERGAPALIEGLKDDFVGMTGYLPSDFDGAPTEAP